MPTQPVCEVLSEESRGIAEHCADLSLIPIHRAAATRQAPLHPRLSRTAVNATNERTTTKSAAGRWLSRARRAAVPDADLEWAPPKPLSCGGNADLGGWETEPCAGVSERHGREKGGSRETRHGNEVIWDWGQGAHSVLRIPRACTSGQRVKRDEQRPATRRLSMWWTGWMVYGNRRHNTPRTMGTE